MSPQTKIRRNFPHAIRQLEHIWIPMSDGTKLAGRIWLPLDADEKPVPAILEYIPYRLTDGTAQRDAVRHPYLAGHGYAAVRVDQRGSGNSEGIMYDEYLPQEQADCLEVIAWLAEQPWCDGNVGMFGKSWGGFNALQVAAHRPPALKAIISIYSTDDRYADDVHYVGGCVLGSQMLAWATTMLAYNAAPPDPTVVGEGWREMWLKRMAQTPPYINAWLSHQRRDEFWQQGSVCEDFSAITCAVYAVGGWADGYTNVVPRLLAGLTAPRKGLIGPWSHDFPEVALPSPTIGFLQESLRWWDYWLKGKENGIMEEPMLTAWLQESEPPRIYYPEWQGRWIAEPTSNLQNQPQTWYLTESGQATQSKIQKSKTKMNLPTVLTHGGNAGIWFHMGEAGGYPIDQRTEDSLATTFDTPPVAEPTSFLGYPVVTLTLSADQPVAHVTIRLCDVAPDGSSTLISWGALNLTHRHSHAEPTPLTPHEKMQVSVQLNLIGHTLAEGHRWRIAIAPTYFPHVWTPPQPVNLTLHLAGESFVTLPFWQDNHLPAPTFHPPEVATPLPMVEIRPSKHQRYRVEDVIAGKTTLTFVNDSGRVRFPNELEYDHKSKDEYEIEPNDPNSALARCHRELAYQRADWHIQIKASAEMSATPTAFHIVNELVAEENDRIVFEKKWTFDIPRDLV